MLIVSPHLVFSQYDTTTVHNRNMLLPVDCFVFVGGRLHRRGTDSAHLSAYE